MAEPILLILATVAEKILNSVLSEGIGAASDDLRRKLEGDPTRKAFEQSLANAIKKYAETGNRGDIAKPLIEENGLLTDAIVIEEVSQILKFERHPNIKVISQRWKSYIENPPQWRDFDVETNLFLEYLENELRSNRVFSPVFESKDINKILITSEKIQEQLELLGRTISDISDLLDNKFSRLINIFDRAHPDLREHIRDFGYYIEEKTRDFVGRRWIFDAINDFLAENPRGYILINGDPGIGKTSLLAKMVVENGYVHHFNIRAEGINKPDMFLRNICAQLIVTYGLNHSIPANPIQDSGFLSALLKDISTNLHPEKHCVIIVDALDEVDRQNFTSGNNLLYLPKNLPNNVYFVITTRKDELVKPIIECEHKEIFIEHNSLNNLQDIKDYVKSFLPKLGIQAFIKDKGLSSEKFTDLFVQKSQGNFMYLRYMLPSIEKGMFANSNLDDIPAGLANYYQDHWRKMRGLDENAWFSYKLPVIVAISVVKEPVSIDLLSQFSNIKSRNRIHSVLSEWEQFLHKEKREFDGETQYRYCFYHSSFLDFLSQKQEISDERVNMSDANNYIADVLWKDLFDE